MTDQEPKSSTAGLGRPAKRYKLPHTWDNSSARVVLPPLDDILDDLEYAGGSLRKFLSEIDETREFHEHILCQIYKELAEHPQAKVRFDKLLDLGRTVQTQLAEEKLYQLIGQAQKASDLQALKFVLERGLPQRFGKEAKGSDAIDKVLEALEKLRTDADRARAAGGE